MSKSIFKQGPRAVAVPMASMMPSPRNYNSSIISFGRWRLMAYRSHRMQHKGRCGVALCEMDGEWNAFNNVWLKLPEPLGTEHHEDPRLFIYRGRLHVAYTESLFHTPDPYTCMMRYARLKHSKKGGWEVDQVFHPRHGANDHSGQQKNWQFFEGPDAKLHCIYGGEPHTVLKFADDGETVDDVHTSQGTVWPWGQIRGGTPPMLLPDGRWLCVFHSSTPYPVAPHWRRYYAGAYVFEPEAPFRITSISHQPILTGSEDDGHGFDPRNVDSWKPFVVFPSGIIAEGESLFVSYGINDYMTAIVDHRDLYLGDPQFKGWKKRFFHAENAAPVPVYTLKVDRPPTFLRWQRARTAIPCTQAGVLAIEDPRVALHISELSTLGISEITEAKYRELVLKN